MAPRTFTELLAGLAPNGAGLITANDMLDYVTNSASWSAGTVDGTASSQALLAGVPQVINQWTEDLDGESGEVLTTGALATTPFQKVVNSGYSGRIGIQVDIDMSLDLSAGDYTICLRVNSVVERCVTFQTNNQTDPYHSSVRFLPIGVEPSDTIDFTIEAAANETFKMLDGSAVFLKRVL